MLSPFVRRTFLLALFSTLLTAGAARAALPAHRVRDIRLQSYAFPTAGGVVLGTTLYFVVDDGTSGTLLWKSDGYLHGTRPLDDFVGGFAPPLNPQILAVAGGRVYFQDANSLWVTGGLEGTHPIRSVLAAGKTPQKFAELGGLVYFVGIRTDVPSTAASSAIWSTDGTDGGTSLVAQVPNSSTLYGLTTVGSALWFVAAYPPENGFYRRYGLYRLQPGSAPALVREFAAEIVPVGGGGAFSVGPEV
jgi:ELWxxDGT repeat protein